MSYQLDPSSTLIAHWLAYFERVKARSDSATLLSGLKSAVKLWPLEAREIGLMCRTVALGISLDHHAKKVQVHINHLGDPVDSGRELADGLAKISDTMDAIQTRRKPLVEKLNCIITLD